MLGKVNKFLTDLSFSKEESCEVGLMVDLKDAIHSLHKGFLSCKGARD